MSSAGDLLRRAAECADTYVVSDKEQATFKLMALHIIHACGAKAGGEQAKLLCELLRQ